jgi:hypothetical protein
MFAALHIGGEDTHMTIMLNVDPTPSDVDKMVKYLKLLSLPIVIVIEPGIVMRGYKNDVPTHNVYICNDHVRFFIEQMYEDTYKQKPEFKQYPKLSAHVSVDKPERAQIVDEYLEKKKGIVIVTSAYIKELGKKEILFSAK